MSSHKLRLRKTNLNLWISGLKEVVKVEDMFADFIQCLVNCAFPLTYPKQNMSIEHCKLSQKTYRKIRISSTRSFTFFPDRSKPLRYVSATEDRSLWAPSYAWRKAVHSAAQMYLPICAPPRLQLF